MLKNVNSTDLFSAIELGCRMMGQVFSKDDNEIPFFITHAWKEACFEYNGFHAESHVPGRHLNALLMAEAITGLVIDEEVVRKHARAAFFSLTGPIPLPLNRVVLDGRAVGTPVSFLDHNIREGMHAMYALSRFRGDASADEAMHCMIEFINQNFIPQMNWSNTVTEAPGIQISFTTFILGVARAIGPLVKYYLSSRYEPSLDLAIRLAEEAVKHYPEDGSFDQELMGTVHAHSITCVLSSLAQLAQATNNFTLIERVRRFYDNGLNELRNELGWAAENTDGRLPARGEINVSGDILETALILGHFYGAQYYDDAERIIRGHILPSQLRDNSFIKNPDDSNGDDRYENVAERHLGAFGFPAPYGHQPKGEENDICFNTDIVGGGVSSLCEAYASCTSYENGIHRIELLFDKKTNIIEVTSPYTSDSLTIIIHKPGPLFVRIPTWVDREKILVKNVEMRICGDYIYIPFPKMEEPICIQFPLTIRNIILHHHTHELRARMQGDVVLAMDNEGTDFTFFEEYQE